METPRSLYEEILKKFKITFVLRKEKDQSGLPPKDGARKKIDCQLVTADIRIPDVVFRKDSSDKNTMYNIWLRAMWVSDRGLS